MVTMGACAEDAPTAAASDCPQAAQNCSPGCTAYPQDGHHEPSIPILVPFGFPKQASPLRLSAAPERDDRSASAKPLVTVDSSLWNEAQSQLTATDSKREAVLTECA